MSEDRRHVQHYHTTNPNATPSPDSLYDGEIALNIAADNEKIYVKNTDGDVVTFRDDKYYQEVISGAVSSKQDKINDLATIRSGAALGATALQTETYKGTVTGVKINGTTKTPTNGTVDLGTVITTHQDISGKVDKETGKGLSTNDYTTTEKNKLAGIASGAEVNVQSDWNVTDTSSDAYIKNKPTIPSAVTESTVSGWGFTKNSGTYSKPSGGIPKSDLDTKVQNSLDKADTALQSVPSEYITETELNAKNYATTSALNDKVDKVTGKQLSTEDFTTALKTKLEGLSNYNDTEITNAVNQLETTLNTLLSGNTNDAINSFNEIIAFLDGVKDSQDLNSIIASIEQQIADKQDKINDLATIRSGAALGATALQSYTEQYKGTITAIQANGTNVATSGTANIPAASTSVYGVTKLSNSTSSTSTSLAATANAVKTAYDLANKKVDKVDGKQLSTEDFTTTLKTKLESVNAKLQDTTDVLDDVETNTYVKYVAQTLTDEQKAQARKNIGIDGTGGSSSGGNVAAVDTGDVLDDVNVEYTTKAYVDELVGDINSVLESIINGGGSKLISFTIYGINGVVSYEASNGMTWTDFVNSNYNSNGDFSLNETNVMYKGTSIKNVVSTDTIISGEEYNAYPTGGSN